MPWFFTPVANLPPQIPVSRLSSRPGPALGEGRFPTGRNNSAAGECVRLGCRGWWPRQRPLGVACAAILERWREEPDGGERFVKGAGLCILISATGAPQ